MSQTLLQLRLALTVEAAICKKSNSVESILDYLRERFRDCTVCSREVRALQQGQLTLRQFGDEVERRYYLSHRTVGPREAECQRIVKFLVL